MSSIFELLGHSNNLDDPEPILNKRSTIYGLLIFSLVLSSFCVVGRIWIRLVITHSPGWDDVFVVLAAICNITLAVSLCIAVDHGLGQHFILLELERVQNFIKDFYIATGAYPLSSTFIKLALLFQYLRLFRKATRSRKLAVAVIGIVCTWGFAFSFLAWVPCVPVRAYWNWTIPNTQAKRYGYGSENRNVVVATYVTNAATNMVLDLVIFAIPMPLWGSKSVPGKTHIALSGLFILGAIVNLLSIIRLVSIVETKAGTYPTWDPSWYGCTPAILSALEVNTATLCASLPVFWPVIQESLGNILVTYEVNVTRETREIEGCDVINESDEVYSMETLTSQYAGDRYIRSQVDPLHQDKMSKTTVVSESQRPLETNGPLDLRSGFRASPGGSWLQRPKIIKRDSKEGLLDA